MRLDDRTANRQAHAHAAGFGRVKRFEHALSMVQVNPLAPISLTIRFSKTLLQLNPISLDERLMLGEVGLRPASGSELPTLRALTEDPLRPSPPHRRIGAVKNDRSGDHRSVRDAGECCRDRR